MEKEKMKKNGCYYRVTINGGFRDCTTLCRALNYIKKYWKDDTSLCDIKIVCKNGICYTGLQGFRDVFDDDVK